MQPPVRDLYKRLLLASRGYPHGMAAARCKLKAAFQAHREADAGDLAGLLSRGEFVLREVQALGRLHKYRYARTGLDWTEAQQHAAH